MKFSNLKKLGFAIAFVAFASNTASAEFDAAKLDKLDKEAGSGFFDDAFSYVGATSWSRTSAQNRVRDAVDSAKDYIRHTGSDASKYAPDFASRINELERIQREINDAYTRGDTSAYSRLKHEATLASSKMLLLANEAKNQAETEKENTRKRDQAERLARVKSGQAAFIEKSARVSVAKQNADAAAQRLEDKRKDIAALNERKSFLESMTSDQRSALEKVNKATAKLEEKLGPKYMAMLESIKVKCTTYTAISDCSEAQARLKEQLVEIEAAKAEINTQVDAWLNIGKVKCDKAKPDLLRACKPETDSERASRRKDMEEFLGMKRLNRSTNRAQHILHDIASNKRRSDMMNRDWQMFIDRHVIDIKSDLADYAKDRDNIQLLLGRVEGEKTELEQGLLARQADAERLAAEAQAAGVERDLADHQLKEVIPGLVEAITDFQNLGKRGFGAVDNHVVYEFLRIKGSLPSEVVSKTGPVPAGLVPPGMHVSGR